MEDARFNAIQTANEKYAHTCIAARAIRDAAIKAATEQFELDMEQAEKDWMGRLHNAQR